MNFTVLCIGLTLLLYAQDVRAESAKRSASNNENAVTHQQSTTTDKHTGLQAPDQYRIYEILPAGKDLSSPAVAPFLDKSRNQPYQNKQRSRNLGKRHPRTKHSRTKQR